jgi:hypothetical protein
MIVELSQRDLRWRSDAPPIELNTVRAPRVEDQRHVTRTKLHQDNTTERIAGICQYTPTDMLSRDRSDGRFPGSRVTTFRRLPRNFPSGMVPEDSPFTVAGAAAALAFHASPHSRTVNLKTTDTQGNLSIG